jgi:hypothetical protein
VTTLPIDALLAPLTPEQALVTSLEVAVTAELPVTAWEEGDTALSLIEVLSYWLAQERILTRGIVASGFLDYAEDDESLTQKALQDYGVSRIVATYAGTVLTVTNTGTDTHAVGANDLTIENSTTGATYRNTSPATGTVDILPGATVSFDVVADVAGSASSSDAGDLDTITSGQLGLTCTNATAAVGRDRESGEALKARCRLKVPAISKVGAGPKGKYAYVAITPEENGGAAVTRCDVRGNSVTGALAVILAGPSGAVSGGDVTLVEAALVTRVVGPCETLTVSSATNATIAVTYALWVYDDVNQTDDDIRAAVSARLAALFALCPIGGWRKALDSNGKVSKNLLEATIKSVSSRAFDVSVSLPAADVNLTENQVPALGAVTGAITREPAPPTGGTL